MSETPENLVTPSAPPKTVEKTGEQEKLRAELVAKKAACEAKESSEKVGSEALECNIVERKIDQTEKIAAEKQAEAEDKEGGEVVDLPKGKIDEPTKDNFVATAQAGGELAGSDAAVLIGQLDGQKFRVNGQEIYRLPDGQLRAADGKPVALQAAEKFEIQRLPFDEKAEVKLEGAMKPEKEVYDSLVNADKNDLQKQAAFLKARQLIEGEPPQDFMGMLQQLFEVIQQLFSGNQDAFWQAVDGKTGENKVAEAPLRGDPRLLEKVPDGGKMEGAIQAGKQFFGAPYVWGGNNRGGIDCSGFVSAALRESGAKPAGYRNTARGFQSESVHPLPVDKVQRGDLMFWGSPATHVEIVLAVNGQQITTVGSASHEKTCGQYTRNFKPGKHNFGRLAA